MKLPDAEAGAWFGLWLAEEPEVLSTTAWRKKLFVGFVLLIYPRLLPWRKNGKGICWRYIQISFLHVCHQHFFFNRVQSGKKKRNTFLAHFTCLTFCFGSYNSTCKSPTILYKALVGYPSLGRHQTLEVATEYLFGAQVGIEYCTMLI